VEAIVKIALVLILILSSFAAQAAEVYGLCITAFAPSTTFEIKSQASQVQFEITNHNGGQYAPFWHSIVVPNDLQMLKEKSETILKLDRGFRSSFPSSSCSWIDENKFICQSYNQKLNVNGIEVKPWALYSSVITDSSFAGDFKYIEMTVLFQADSKEYNYTMRYPAEECLLSEKPLDGLQLKKIKNKNNNEQGK